jgi:hypothetical protein
MSKKNDFNFNEGEHVVYTDNYGFWARAGDPILPGSTVRIVGLMQPFGSARKDYATIQDVATGATMLARTVDLQKVDDHD